MKKITFLTTVLALFAFLALPMGMWGQSDYSMDYTGNITLSTTGGSNATNCKVLISNTEYNGIKAGTGSKVGAMMITVPANTKYLHLHVAAWNGENSSALAVTPEGYSENIALTSNSGISGNSPFTFSGDPSTSDYYKVITFTTALEEDTDLTFTATGGKRFVIWGVTSEEEGSGVATPTFNPANGTTFGDEGLEVSIACVTDGAIIYYTTDGEVPTNESTVYNEPFTITETTTVKAIAYVDEDASGVASATYTYVDPNAPGSLNNPYTVAQARAAIDAGTGVNGVYATGIVSEIVDPYSSQFLNVTFNMVDAEGDVDFLQAYRCGGDLAPEVALGDVVVVYGNLIYYGNGSLYEFAQGCQVVTVTHPVAPVVPSITVTPATLNVDAQEHLVNYLDLAYENIDVVNASSFTVHYYDAEGEEIQVVPGEAWMIADVVKPNDVYQVLCVIVANEGEARTAYFKLSALDAENNTVYSNLVTVNQEAYVAPTYADLPFAFNSGKAHIEETDGLYQEGLGSDYGTDNTKLKFDNTGDWLLLQFDERPGTLTFDIKGNGFNGSTFTVQTSEDGTTYSDLATYTELTSTVLNEEFTNLGENVRYIKWIYTEKVQSGGNVGLGNIALAEYTEPQQYTLTVEPFENLDLITFVNDEMVLEGDGEIQVTNGDQIMLSVVAMEGYVMETLMVNGVNHVNDIADDFTYTFVMPAENVTISATAVEDVPPTPGEWVMVGLNDLTEDDVFVIVGVYDEDESSFAMPNNGTGAPSAVDVTMVGNTLAGDIAENLKWNLSIGEDGYTFYPNGETESWLYCNNTNNGVRVGTNENNVFTMTPEGYLYNNATSRYIGIYNRQDWRCYTSINNNIKNQTFAFYKRVDEGSLVTYTLDIEGYADTTNAGGYYLIASPVSMIRPTFENGFITEAYDLYYFDQAQNDYEWRNYKAKHFNIASGKGYLYASQENTTLTFTGIPYNGDNDGAVALDYDENATFAGWNLIGNPYYADASLYFRFGNDYNSYVEAEFYVMNDQGTDFELANRQARPMEGVFVKATAANEFACFNDGSWWGGDIGEPLKLNIRVSDENGKGDFARIRFGEGNNFEKFMLNPNNTKIYFPVDNEEYAVVYTDNMGEMPLNFSAAADGTYTLNIHPEDMEMEYLHLIDNMTGMDVDLLANPTYSFEATTNDNAARFTLVFAGLTGIEENSDNFAFFSNGNVIVSNEGNAMLQVVDMNGRVVKSENINGTTSVSVEAAPGVYMLRLVNGDNMKVQKIIVK